MSTPCEIPGSRPQAGVSLAAPVALSVAEDLAAIFPHEPPIQPATALRLGRRRESLTAVKRPLAGRAATMGVIAGAAALLGVAAGALLGPGASPARSAAQASVPASTAVALPSPGPLPAGPLHAAPRQAVVRAPIAPVKVRKVSEPRSAAHRKRSAPAHRASTCRGADCRTPSIVAADARLRRAYDFADDAGVSHKVLSDYHDEWARLRRQAPRRPRVVAARYDAMAGELNSMAVGRERATRASRSDPWRALRTQFAALWR